MKKIVFLIVFGVSLAAFSQQSPNFLDNVLYGGGFTLGFGNQQTTIGISPSAVYDFNNGLYLGSGVGYLYSRISDFTTNTYSTSIIALYQTRLGIQVSGDLEYYFAKQSNLNGSSVTTNFPAFHLGIAYNQGRFALGIRYDVLYDVNRSIFASPFSPVVRFYF